ncbi:hypothetical protein D3C86_1886680 [compost metagenome]
MDSGFEVGQPIAIAFGWNAQASGGGAHAFFPDGFFRRGLRRVCRYLGLEVSSDGRRLVSPFVRRKQVGLYRNFPSKDSEDAYF